MSSENTGQSGNFLVNLKDFSLYCIPFALLACLFAYVQLVLISSVPIGSVNFFLPALLGMAIGVLVIINRKLAQHLARKMITDPLTGTLNRRWLEFAKDELLKNCSKDGKPLTVVLFDIDHFRQINDVHGHQPGDDVLRQLAQIVSRSLRGSDWLVRWGGEEFMIILPGCTSSGGMTIAERLRLVIASYNFQAASLVTCSFGVAQFNPELDQTLEQFIMRADRGLLEAKVAGRNKVQDADAGSVANAENTDFDNRSEGHPAPLHSVSSARMQEHARNLLDASYVKKLMVQSLVISIIVFPFLAWAKFILVDGISVGIQHFLLPLIVATGIGYLVGKMRILDKAIKTQVVLDPLTKAYNRHWLAGYGRQLIHLCQRSGHPMSLALIEIDDFKSINAKFGNACGDAVLQQAANAIREATDGSTRLVRWSGKVFMLFLPEVDSEKALEIVENVRKVIEAKTMDPVPKITASIGLSCFNKEQDSALHTLIERASNAMSQASGQGMNCIRVG